MKALFPNNPRAKVCHTLPLIPSKHISMSVSNSQLLWLVKNTSSNSRVLLLIHNMDKCFGKNENTFNILLIIFTNQITLFSKLYKISTKYLVC